MASRGLRPLLVPEALSSTPTVRHHLCPGVRLFLCWAQQSVEELGGLGQISYISGSVLSPAKWVFSKQSSQAALGTWGWDGRGLGWAVVGWWAAHS